MGNHQNSVCSFLLCLEQGNQESLCQSLSIPWRHSSQVNIPHQLKVNQTCKHTCHRNTITLILKVTGTFYILRKGSGPEIYHILETLYITYVIGAPKPGVLNSSQVRLTLIASCCVTMPASRKYLPGSCHYFGGEWLLAFQCLFLLFFSLPSLIYFTPSP